MQGTPMTVVDAATLADDVLERLHERVLRPSFAPDEAIGLEAFMADVRGGTSRVWAALGETGEADAAVVLDRYPMADLISYLAVRPGLRGGGRGGVLLAHVQARADERPLFGEVEHPAYHHADPVLGDPMARVRLYERLGIKVVEVPFFVPRLRPSSRRVGGMMLVVAGRHRSAGFIEADVVRAFLLAYRDAVGDDVDDALWRAVLAALPRGRRVPLTPILAHVDRRG